jgi:hypothetical protein
MEWIVTPSRQATVYGEEVQNARDLRRQNDAIMAEACFLCERRRAKSALEHCLDVDVLGVERFRP